MISIQQNLKDLDLKDLEKSQQLHAMVLDCYLGAIRNVAHYAVDIDAAITVPHRKYLTDLAVELAEASPDALSESRSTFRGLLRDYRDRAAQHLADLRSQLTSTATALREMVEGLSQCDTDHNTTLRGALGRLREVANAPDATPVRSVVRATADAIEHSLEQMRKQHKFTISQLQTEMRLLHGRIDHLEAAATTDEVTKFSNNRFLAEYMGALPAEGACFLILKMRGLAEARARLGAAVADDLVATFGRRLRNTVPKDTVVGRWSEQDFLAIVPAAGKPADGNLIKRFAEHLSMPYASMIAGKVVRIPLIVTVECLDVAPGVNAQEIQARVAEAFK
jgi:GGDEF domain-containing protein